jgi:hypothetical protein
MAAFVIGPDIGDDTSRRPLDHWQIAWAQSVYAGYVRADGNIENGLVERLTNPSQQGPTFVVADPLVNAPDVVDRLIRLGAIAWKADEGAPTSSSPPLVAADRARGAASVVSLRDLINEGVDLGSFLAHCTRSPTESGAERLAEVAWRRRPEAAAIDEATRTLCAILADQRLVASGKLIPGGHPVVCWTEVRLDQLARHRTFQSHLGRWDFLPCGLAVRRDALIGLGALPVRYELLPPAVSDADRPLYHPPRTVTAAGREIDWTAEREWRMVGDVDLRRVGVHDALVFVPSHRDAPTVASLSRWPVVVMQAPE